jgi:hypothetical protein
MPSWVQQIEGQDEEIPPLPSMDEADPRAKDQAPVAPSQNKPDWLKELTGESGLSGGKSPADERTPASNLQTPVEELPDWLRIASEEKQEPAKAPPSIQAERKAEPPPPPPIVDAVEPEEIEPARAEEIPSWVADLNPTEDQPTAAAEPFRDEAEPAAEPIEPARAEEIPSWIAELKPTQDQPAAPQQPLQVAAEPLAEPIEPARAEQIPAWIAELKPTVEEPAEPAPEFEAEVHTEELADWLRTPQLGSSMPMMPLEFERSLSR